MIIVQASSGTGNQLFQYAAGRALSLRAQLPLLIDAFAFHAGALEQSRLDARAFVLSDLDLPIRVIGHQRRWWYQLRGAQRLRDWTLGFGRRPFLCAGQWRPEFDQPGPALLKGYFQDQRYFGTFADEIVAELDAALDRLAEQARVSVPDTDAALHVRRSDYVGHVGTDTGWFEHYYQLALARLRDLGSRRIAIFSDDPAWCHAAFADQTDVLIMPIDPRSGGLLDLWRMSRHPHLAICNSTFSWWAARLGMSKGMRVIAPTRWAQWCPDPEPALMQSAWHRLG